MSEQRKRNIIIATLCVVVLLMTVGYAAFQTSLNITGISNISSNWNIKITNVTTKNVVGGATNNGEPTFDGLNATFKTNLVSPGDSINYDITITNSGNINAKLNKITFTDTNNPAIKFTTSGLTEGDTLLAGKASMLSAKVEYLSTVTNQPANVSSNLTVTLDYDQVSGSGVVPPITAADQLKEKVITTGEGLYADAYETGRFVYRGTSPNNYITFNEEPWRIISIEADNTLKIIKNNILSTPKEWDISGNRFGATNTYCLDGEMNGCNAWSKINGIFIANVEGTVSKDSSLNQYLNNDYYTSLSEKASSLIQPSTYDIGNISYTANQDFNTDIAQSQKYQWNGKVGLISLIDYIKASNEPLCNSVYRSVYYNEEMRRPCNNGNYLYDSGNYWWTITGRLESTSGVWILTSDGGAGSYGGVDDWYKAKDKMKVRPAVSLKYDITLSGDGTSANPYTIN